MKKNSRSRSGFIHLYNPKKEGLGSYDVHYINAYKKDKSQKNQDSSWNIRDKSFSLSLTDFGAKIRFSLGHFSQISLTYLNEILKFQSKHGPKPSFMYL